MVGHKISKRKLGKRRSRKGPRPDAGHANRTADAAQKRAKVPLTLGTGQGCSFATPGPEPERTPHSKIKKHEAHGLSLFAVDTTVYAVIENYILKKSLQARSATFHVHSHCFRARRQQDCLPFWRYWSPLPRPSSPQRSPPPIAEAASFLFSHTSLS